MSAQFIPAWNCEGDLHGTHVMLQMVGGNQMLDVLAQVPATTGRAAAVGAFTDVVRATEPFFAEQQPILAWLEGWDGVNSAVTFGASSAQLQTDATWIILYVIPDKEIWSGRDVRPICPGFPLICP